MKKILFLSMAIAAMLFTSCEKDEESGSYTVTISPSTISMSSGDTFKVTVSGEGAEDIVWMACYEYVEDTTIGSCLPFNNGTELELPASIFTVAGEYEIHTYAITPDIDLGRLPMTVTE